MPEKIRVLVIDDSAMVRKVITDTLHQDPDIEVVGTAQDPLFAIEKIPKLRPDVLTLDMEMPRMDGLTFLRKLKAEKSTIPVVVVSALTQQGSQMALDAMEAGACDILAKPDGSYSIGALAGRLGVSCKSSCALAPPTPADAGENRAGKRQRTARGNCIRRPGFAADSDGRVHRRGGSIALFAAQPAGRAAANCCCTAHPGPFF